MTTATPTISVVIPAYNAEKFVHVAIESALHQTLKPLEILVIDDGSTDNTAAAVGKYAPMVRLVQQQNGGPAAARNHGIRLANGDWLALLDADDSWLPQRLEAQAPSCDDPAVGIVRCFRADEPIPNGAQHAITFNSLWRRNEIDNSSVLVRKSAVAQVGGFNEDRALIAVEDYNLWLRLTYAGWKVATCPQGLWRYTPAPGNLSSQIARFAAAELASVTALEKELPIPHTQAEAKRRAIRLEYGRQLVHYRQPKQARELLTPNLRTLDGTAAFWFILSLLPPRILDGFRQARAHPSSR